MSIGYPSTAEVLEELDGNDAASGQAMEGDPSGEATTDGAAREGEGQASETPFLDFDQYKGHHVTYKANGKEVTEPFEKVLQRAQMGYDYAQKTADLKNNYIPRSELETGYVPKEKYDAIARYEQYDKYARENPTWAEHVENSWNNRDVLNNPNVDPQDPQFQAFQQLLQPLQERLTQYEQRFGQVDEFIQSSRSSAEDKALDNQISEVKQQFDYIDFDQVDPETGNSIEMRVLDHMEQTGIKNFKTAVVDLYQDQIISQGSSKALEKSAQERQRQAKQGVVGVSQTPTAKPQPGSRVPRSDQEAYQDALAFIDQQ